MGILPSTEAYINAIESGDIRTLDDTEECRKSTKACSRMSRAEILFPMRYILAALLSEVTE